MVDNNNNNSAFHCHNSVIFQDMYLKFCMVVDILLVKDNKSQVKDNKSQVKDNKS